MSIFKNTATVSEPADDVADLWDTPDSVTTTPSEVERRLPWFGLAALLVVALLVGLAVRVSNDDPPAGEQVAGNTPIEIRTATGDEWTPMRRLGGDARPGFPEPMVRGDGALCVGFGRVDFPVESRRPSVARCESRPGPLLTAGELRQVVSVTSGLDTWQFVELSDDVVSVSVTVADGTNVAPDRLYAVDSLVALRLENGQRLGSIDWTFATAAYRCTTDPEAWTSGRFCDHS